jgi:hypothetical protein
VYSSSDLDGNETETLQEAQKIKTIMTLHHHLSGAAGQCHCMSQVLQHLLLTDTPFGAVA